ncbi:XRE family transcriptional regulator [Actinomadura graeca]|uniref:XRE family transcriptional regulator n=1 Tax=Actinomadura graeca TaxID=2750812 RepID=A0ABX8R2Q1_9ACTN|nr:XRE family transcriptional regulator [Actinomadura graeca]QXJ24709.1 XRE family transcriptional regulator [Actinomadura graeca]
MKRRTALQIISAITAGTAIPPGATKIMFSGLDDSLGRPLDLPEWEATVHQYGQAIVSRPAGALIKDLTADVVTVSELLDRPDSATDQAALFRISAGLSGILAIDLGDVGEKRAARIAWNIARRTADASGDQDLRVWARGRAAQDAFWLERPRTVVMTLAAEAIEIADGKPSAGLARAHAVRVYAAADGDDASEAEKALRDLKDVFARLPQDTDDQSVLAYRESQLHWAESYAQTWRGDRHAETSLANTLSLYPLHATAPRENLSLMKAAVLIKNREVDAGLDHALATMENSHRGAAGRIRLVKQVLRILPENARTLPVARELHAFTAAN